MLLRTSSILVAVLAARSVVGHAVITAVTGANGNTGAAFGVDPSTPRDGTTRKPFQQDSSIIRDNDISSGKADACGRTLEGGNNVIATQMQTAASAGLPDAQADGTVTMTLHQVNGDGAGPFTCDVNTDGTGQTFQAMTVTQQVPGKNSRSNAKAEDFPLTAQMPANAQCTGGPNGDACIVRCRNDARAGPFGGCVAVTNNAAGAGAANGTAAAGSAAAGTAANSTAAAGTAGTAAGSAAGTNAAQAGTAQAGAGQAAAAGNAATGNAATGSTAADSATGQTAKGAASGATAAKGAAAAGGAGKGLLGKLKGAAGGKAAGANAATAATADTADTAGAATGAKAAGGGLLSKLKQNRATIPDDPVSDEERDAALAEDLERRDVVQKRVLKSRIVGASNAGRWI